LLPCLWAATRQNRSDLTACGSQRFRCFHCKKHYTPVLKHHGYPDELRLDAVKLYVDGTNFRRIAHQLGVNHQTVINWINAHHKALQEAGKIPPHPDGVADTLSQSRVETLEFDELYTFIEHKKTIVTS
jgi:hypothetical protein